MKEVFFIHMGYCTLTNTIDYVMKWCGDANAWNVNPHYKIDIPWTLDVHVQPIGILHYVIIIKTKIIITQA
jgi:hypothetical protein